jgi:glutamyl/glutaminyl-tRNA synthetase
MDGAPLSKRHGDLSLRDLRKRGYLPSAVRNHLVRLGHSCVTDGWLDAAAMLKDFDLGRLGRAAAKFDEAQLLHWQKEAVAHLSMSEFELWAGSDLPAGLDARQKETLLAALRHNVVFPADITPWIAVIFGRLPDLVPEAAAAVRDAGGDFFATAAEVFARVDRDFKQAAREIGQLTSRKGPSLYMPLRAALTGMTHGPELAPLLQLIPAEEVRTRLQAAQRIAA